MRIEEAKYSVIEIAEWLRKKDLSVNKEYQRSGGLWPKSAKSYFIDTILKGFPFPRIYFHEMVDREQRRPKREIVDGQQRVGAIVDFLENRFRLTNPSDFLGNTFEELNTELQDAFCSYPVSVGVIRNAERSEILQMFRRMNAYTLPLNNAEKLQSDFSGEFKTWVNKTLDEVEGVIVDWQVLSSRQILRKLDTEFITDLALAIDQGILSTSPTLLRRMYRENDEDFPAREFMNNRILGTLEFVRNEMPFVVGTMLTRTHVFFSLLCALIHNRWGLPHGNETIGLDPIGRFWESREAAEPNLLRLAAAHEEKDLAHYEEYITAASEGGNRANQRAVRTRWLCRALRGDWI
jgi:hypothetical protein